MANPTRDPFEDLEKYRVQLEDNVTKLRKALQHWQTWEAEYEAFKEAVDELPADAEQEELSRVGAELEGELLIEKEIDDLTGLKKGISRTPKQVSDLLDRRIDYVRQNVRAMQRQFDAAETKLASAKVVSNPDARTEEGLPVTDIYEELDEDGNVISSKVVNPGSAASDALDSLKKAGIEESDLPERADTGNNNITSVDESDVKLNTSIEERSEPVSEIVDAATLAETPSQEERIPRRKKSVSFAKGTKQPATEPSAKQTPSKPSASRKSFSPRASAKAAASSKASLSSKTYPASKASPSPKASSSSGASSSAKALSSPKVTPSPKASPTPKATSSQSSNTSRKSTSPSSQILQGEVLNVGEAATPISAAPGAPSNESEADAALRREMLEYSMSEMNNIVAQLDIVDSDEDDDDEDDDDMSEDSDDENAYGLSTSSNISDDYRNAMLKLEEKLNARMLRNLGPEGEGVDVPLSDVHDSADNAAVDAGADAEAMSKEKIVRFAEDLDIAPAGEGKPVPGNPKSNPQEASPLKDIIVERPSQPLVSSTTSATIREPSKFKASRASATASTSAPQAPSNTPLVSNIIERPPSTPATDNRPPSPDEFAPSIVRQQVATDYYNMRNKFIQREGGFSQKRQEEMDMEEELRGMDSEASNSKGQAQEAVNMTQDFEDEDEEEEKPVKKVSLFKAARLKNGGL